MQSGGYRSFEAVEAEASKKSRSCEWMQAAELYRQILELLVTASAGAAQHGVTTQLLARSYFRAAFQSENRDEFVRRMQLAESTYLSGADLYEKAGLDGLAKLSKAAELFSSFWIKEDAQAKRIILGKCISLTGEAIGRLDPHDNARDVAQAHSLIVSCIVEHIPFIADWSSLKSDYAKAVESGERAIEEFTKLGQDESLIEILDLTLATLNLGKDRSMLDPSKSADAKKRAERLTAEIATVAARILTPYAECLAELSAANFAYFFQGDHLKALSAGEKAMALAERTKDSYLISRVLYVLIGALSMGEWSEEDIIRKRELLEKGTSLYPSVIQNLQISSNVANLADAHGMCSTIHTQLSSLETYPESKRAHLKAAVEYARKAAAYEEVSVLFLYPLSKAIFFLARMETNLEEKRRLLQEALPLRERVVQKTDLLFPDSPLRGTARNYLALIKAELARVSNDPQEKTSLLQSALTDQRQCIELRRRPSMSNYETSVLTRYLEWYGDIQGQLYKLTNESDMAGLTVKTYQECITYLDRLKRNAAIPQLRWKIAKIHDATSNYKEASLTFTIAANEYQLSAEKIQSLGPAFGQFASYMEAWSLIERARVAHMEDQLLLAAENYSKAAGILQHTTSWHHLFEHYAACSLYEKGEELSRRETPDTSLESFDTAAKTFRQAKEQLELMENHNIPFEEREEVDNWLRITLGRESACKARVELEHAKILDRKGEEEASGRKYSSARDIFNGLMDQDTNPHSRKELETLGLYCDAWAKMKEAEVQASPALYTEAAESFTKIEETATKKTARISALADAAICRALAHGTEFRRTRNTELYSRIKTELETANDYYHQTGLQKAADWARATAKLFDALVYMTEAASEKDSRKKAELYHLAEKHMELSAKLYGQAGFSTKRDEALRHLETVREEKELLVTPVQALAESPAISGTVLAPASLDRDEAFGLERFEAANVVGKLSVARHEVSVGTNFTLELDLTNVGKTPATLLKLENVAAAGLEIDKENVRNVQENNIDMRGKRLDYLSTHALSIPLKAKRKGVFQLGPRILFVDENGNHRSYNFETASITVKELGISGWLKGPK